VPSTQFVDARLLVLDTERGVDDCWVIDPDAVVMACVTVVRGAWLFVHQVPVHTAQFAADCAHQSVAEAADWQVPHVSGVEAQKQQVDPLASVVCEEVSVGADVA
jgi:hypothetical protein